MHSILLSFGAIVFVAIIGMVFFIFTLAIIKYGSQFLGYSPNSEWAVFSASLLVSAILIAFKTGS